MPLSKVKQAEWMRGYRKRKKLGITDDCVIPKYDPNKLWKMKYGG